MNLNITAAQLRELDPGQTIAQVVRFTHADAHREAIKEAQRVMTQNISNKIGRAKASIEGASYTMETFVTHTSGLDTLAGVAVTRTA